MKKILFALIVPVLALSSCNLMEEPTTQLSEKTIFSTEAGLEAAVVGCYNSFKAEDLWQGRLAEYLQCGSIITHWKGNRILEPWLQGLRLTMYSTDMYNQNAFGYVYSGINMMNSFLDKLGDSPVDAGYKNSLAAEVRFLRAVMYFFAVRMWGDIPLVTSSPKTLEEANLPRTSYFKVYAQILDDLSFAEKNMRTPEQQTEINGMTNRAHKWAATAYKAVVYNQIACILSSPDDQPFREKPDFTCCGIETEDAAWKASLEAAEKVINEGPYRLAEKFGDLFRWTDTDDWYSPERILVCTSCDLGYSELCHWTLPDFLEGTQHVSAKAASFARIRPERWVLQKWSRTYGGTLATGRTDGMTNVYLDCLDPRYDCSYIYGSYYNQNTEKTVKVYPTDGSVTGMTETSTSSRQQAPYFKKYVDPTYNVTNGNADWYMLRLAEIYLDAAEACAGLSKSVGDEKWQECFDYIEVLHKRARHSVKTGPDSPQPKWEAGRFATKDELVSALYWERVFELHGELHDWFDMRRRGARWTIDNLCKPMNVFLQEPEQGPGKGVVDDGKTGYFNNTYLHTLYPETEDKVLEGLLCAFPDSEIRNNTAIDYSDQNPYFIK